MICENRIYFPGEVRLSGALPGTYPRESASIPADLASFCKTESRSLPGNGFELSNRQLRAVSMTTRAGSLL